MYYIMIPKNIIIIIVSLLLILYASFTTLQRDIEVKNILNAPIELYDVENNDNEEPTIEEFQLYTPKCSNLSLNKCFNSFQCGLSVDAKNNLYCQEGRLEGPYDYPTKTWVYNGKCWGQNCDNITSYLNNLPNNPYDPNNFISPYNPGYKLNL